MVAGAGVYQVWLRDVGFARLICARSHASHPTIAALLCQRTLVGAGVVRITAIIETMAARVVCLVIAGRYLFRF